MGGATPWPVRVAQVGPISMGSTLWRCGGQLSATIVAKATFALSAGQQMTVGAPVPIHTRDVPSGALLSSPRAPADTAPQLLMADVTLFGHAYATPTPGSDEQGTATETTVVLSVGRGDEVLLEKPLRIVGDRVSGAAPAPFERMPVVYERAWGGPDYADNPIGIGKTSSAKGQANILAPGVDRGAVVGYAPIPLFFQSRAKLLGTTDRGVLRKDIADIDIGFDWRYFQAAPPDQQLPALHGDEWIELRGLSPNHARLRSWLPGASAVTRVYGHEHANVPDAVPLRPDLLHIEPDQQRCSVVWRGSFPLADSSLADSLLIAGGLELPGRPVHWPETMQQALSLASAGPLAADKQVDPDGTARTAVYHPRQRKAAASGQAPQSAEPAGEGLLGTIVCPPQADGDGQRTQPLDRRGVTQEAADSDEPTHEIGPPAEAGPPPEEGTKQLSAEQLLGAVGHSATPFKPAGADEEAFYGADPWTMTARPGSQRGAGAPPVPPATPFDKADDDAEPLGSDEPGPKTAHLADLFPSEEPDPLRYLLGGPPSAAPSSPRKIAPTLVDPDENAADGDEPAAADGAKPNRGAGKGSPKR